MAAANTDKLRKKKSNFSTTLSAGINDSDATIPLSSASGLATDTAITLTVDRVDGNSVSTPTLVERLTGVISGNNLTVTLRGEDGSTAQAHDAGAVVEDIWDADTWNESVDAILAEHSQAGAHTVDVISEKTAATGVTIDSLLIKDGQIGPWDGWMPADESWSYASATTITVPSGAASKYQKGDKWKLTANSVVLKGYIIGVADTVLTVVGDALTNHTFTANYYSKVENPQGFPTSFAYTSVVTALAPMTIGTITTSGRFSIKGNVCSLSVRGYGTTDGTASNAIYITYPVTAVNSIAIPYCVQCIWESGTFGWGVVIINNGATMTINRPGGASWPLTANNGLLFANFSYEF